MNLKQNKINNIDYLQIKGVFFLLHMNLLTFTNTNHLKMYKKKKIILHLNNILPLSVECVHHDSETSSIITAVFKSSHEFSPPCWNNLYD